MSMPAAGGPFVSASAEDVGTLAHDLRSSISVIFGYALTLARNDGILDDSTRRAALEAVAERCRTVCVLVDALVGIVEDAAISERPTAP